MLTKWAIEFGFYIVTYARQSTFVDIAGREATSNRNISDATEIASLITRFGFESPFIAP